MAELGKDEKGGGAILSGSDASAQPSAPAKKVYAQLQVPTAEQIVQEDFMNHCAVRTIMAGVLGSGLGLVFGLVMGSMDMAGPGLDGAGAVAEKQTTRQALRQMATTMSQRSWTYAKGFGAMGAMFSGSECVIEKIRAKHDIYNSVGAGCFAGAALAHSGGPKAMCAGCVTFAAFSAFIDRIMDHD